MSLPPGLALLATYLAAGLGGFVAYHLHLPLPWMIGSMLVTAGLALSGHGVKLPRLGRRVGQVIVGMAIGLYFTHQAAAETIAHMGAMVGAAVVTLLLGIVAGVALARLARVELTMALLSSVPGGPAEMSNLAESYGYPGAPVALSQSFRIAIIVLVIPPVLIWGGIMGHDGTPLDRVGGVDWGGLPMLIGGAVAAGFIFTKLRVVNGWLLGAIATTAMLTANDVHLSAIPFPMLAGGQVLLGASLGAMFDRRLLDGAGRFLLASFVITVGFIIACAILALLLAGMTDLEGATLVLALAPGSVTEMCLTAEVLSLGVPIVAAFHVIRIFLIVLGTPWLVSSARTFSERRAAARACPASGD